MHLDAILHPIKVQEMHENGMLSLKALHVFLALFRHLNGLYYPEGFQISHKKLAKKARVCLKTLRRSIWELQRAGLIKFSLGTGHIETTYIVVDILGDRNTMRNKEVKAITPEIVKEIVTKKIWSLEWFKALREKLKTYRSPKGVNCRFDEFGTIGEDANYIRGVGRAMYLEIAQIDYRASIT